MMNTSMMEPTGPEIRTFVGKNADYYLNVWFPEDRMSQPVSGAFNAAALWGSCLWLAYRKMYGKGAFFMVAFVSAQLAMVFLLVLITLVAPNFFTVNALELAVTAVIPVVNLLMLAFFCGTYGNLLYQGHVYKSIAEERISETVASGASVAHSNRGGTSWLGAIVFAIVLSVLQILLTKTFLFLLAWVAANLAS